MKKSLILAAFCGMLICHSCSPVRDIKTDKAPGFSIGNYKTFDFYELDVAGEELVPNFSQRIGWLKEEIARQLVAKGLSQSSGNPDLLINIGVKIEEKVQTREADIRTDGMRYMGQRNYSWEAHEIPVGTYKDGSVKIDFIDKAKGSQVWQGSAASVIVKKDEESKKNVAAGIAKLFSEMP